MYGIIQSQSAPYKDATFLYIEKQHLFDFKVGTFLETEGYNTHPEWQYTTCVNCDTFPKHKSYKFMGHTLEWNHNIMKWLKSNKWDGICTSGYDSLTDLYTIIYAIINKIPLVMALDTVSSSGKLKKIKKRIFNRVNAFWVPGNRSKKYLMSIGVPEEKIFKGVYTYDYEEIRKIVSKTDRKKLRDDLEIKEDEFVFLFVGKLIHSRRPDILMHAIKKIERSERKIRFIVIGDGEGSADMQALAQVNERLIYIPSVPLSRLYDYYAVADAYVHPGYEPYSCATMQAAAAGIPVVATNEVGCIDDFLEDKKNGRIVSIGDSSSLTNAMIEIYDNMESYKGYAKLKQEWICNNISVPFAAKQLESAYKR